MPDNTIRNDIQKAMKQRIPGAITDGDIRRAKPITEMSATTMLAARKKMAKEIAKRNAAYTPLGQAAKGSLWRGPDRPVGPLIKRQMFKPTI